MKGKREWGNEKYIYNSENLKGRGGNLVDIGVDGRLILKEILRTDYKDVG
jgi:hypothetical protein